MRIKETFPDGADVILATTEIDFLEEALRFAIKNESVEWQRTKSFILLHKEFEKMHDEIAAKKNNKF